MHQLRFKSLILLLAPVVLAGCSTTMGSRFAANTPSKAKSITVVGDRPMQVTTGEPENKVAANDDVEPEPKRNPKTRISGRVVDEDGRPVAGATVRLADGTAKGGKDIRTTTDPSGAFTLNGLRTGSTYSLIAEGEDDDGPLMGRIKAKTADTGVEISLIGEETEAPATARKPTRTSRARPISNVEDTPAQYDRTGINREDIRPPAEDADTLDPGPSQTSGPGRTQLSPPEPALGWRNGTASKASRPRDDEAETIASNADDQPRKARPKKPAAPPAEDEDGPNPLPPAIEAGASADPDDSESKPRPPARTTPRKKAVAKPAPKAPDAGEIAFGPEASLEPRRVRPKTVADAESDMPVASQLLEIPPALALPEIVAEAGPTARPKSIEVASTPSVAVESSTGLPTMTPVGPDPLEVPKPVAPPPMVAVVPQAVPAVAPASQPVFASQAQPFGPEIAAQPQPSPPPASPRDYNPFALVATTQIVPEPVKALAQSPQPVVTVPQPVAALPQPIAEAAPVVAEVAPEVVEAPAAVAAGPKRKWGDVAVSEKPATAEESPKMAAAAAAPSLGQRVRATFEGRDPAVAQCSYDEKQHKIHDFRLVDLEGKPVKFHDFDADYILLDFWGSWCQPCVQSIPHLVEIQKKYGPGRLKVVGIACEKVPPQERMAKVNEAARQLGINYSVLVAGMDGKPCPLSKALQVKELPTMVLVDRKGQVVWRGIGTAPGAQDRLDRVLASTLSRGTAQARR